MLGRKVGERRENTLVIADGLEIQFRNSRYMYVGAVI